MKSACPLFTTNSPDLPDEPAINHDQLNVTGTVTIGNNVTLDPILFAGFDPAANDTFIIINNDEEDAVTGTFAGLAEGATFTDENVTYQITYAGGDGNDVVLTSLFTSFVVTTTADSGAGSLRQAILDANALAGTDQIVFDITSVEGAGPHTISPTTALPVITDAVTIDGYSETGASENALAVGNDASIQIILDGTSAGAVNGLEIQTSGVIVRGLSIVNFGINGVEFNGTGHVFEGNFIGVLPDGTTDGGNSAWGIRSNNGNARIGTNGDGINDAGERNVISANDQGGVLLFGSGTTIAGNYIGTNAAGTAALGNQTPIATVTGGNIIGTDGSNDAFNVNERNVISGNANGMTLDADIVAGNFIGTDATGLSAIPNGTGIQIGGIGGRVGTNADGIADDVEGNVISGNTGVAIFFVTSDSITVAGNLIGTDVTGTLALGNGEGIAGFPSGINHQIGGPLAVQRNVISANSGIGINVEGSGFVIENNYIGVDINGTDLTPGSLGNSGDGIVVLNANPQIRNNVISNNAGDGINISGTSDGIDASAVLWLRAEGDATDEVGSNNGTLENGATFATGLSGQAFSLDGVDDFVSVADDPTLNFGTGDFSVDTWVNFDTLAGEQILVEKYVQASNATGWSLTKLAGNSIQVAVGDGSTFATVTSSPLAISTGQWHHFAFTRAGDTFTVYFDGQAVATNSYSGNLDSTSTLKLGHRGAPGDTPGSTDIRGFYLNGLIEETAVYGKALTLNEITDIVARNGAGKQDTGAVIAGNTIGLNAAGDADLGNAFAGIGISNSPDNLIGGDSPSDRNIISGNNVNGIQILGAASVGNTVAGNYIGTNAVGDTAIGNANGIEIAGGATDNLIGGEENVISGNTGFGIRLTDAGTDINHVAGNIIGLDASGTTALGNNVGVQIDGGAANNQIGGSTLDEQNVISGNTTGVLINAAGADNHIVGNYIGVDVNGTDMVPGTVGNTEDGITVLNAAPLIQGNVISNNAGDGIDLSGSGASGNIDASAVAWFKAEGDATDSAGNNDATLINGVDFVTGVNGGQAWEFNSAPGATGSDQILVADSPSLDLTSVTLEAWVSLNVLPTAANSIIVEKGTSNGAENYGLSLRQGAGGTAEINFEWYNGGFHSVSSTGAGIQAGQFYHIAATADGSTIRLYVDGELIHDEAQSSPLLPNNNPLYIGSNEGSSFGNRLQGRIDELAIYNAALPASSIATIFARNGAGKLGAIIQGNIIGLNATGDTALGNAANGIDILNSPANVIGGDSPSDRNVISGNTANGVLITGAISTGNVLIGNYIGLDVSGTIDLGNSDNGVLITSGAHNNRIGTDGNGVNDTAERNVISGNTDLFSEANVNIIDAHNNIVAGNYIGTNAAGTSALVTTGRGVRVAAGATFNTIGTDGSADTFNASERNVVSGNTGAGIFITTNSDDNTVAGNYVGLNAAGDAVIGNGEVGISVDGSQRTLIGTNADGTADAFESNVVAGSAGAGIQIAGSQFTTIAGNLIGLNPAGTIAMPNQGGGVLLGNAAINNTIGGTSPAERNVISGNTGDGVSIIRVFNSTTLQPSPDNNIVGNFIGTDITGTAALGNTGNGIYLEELNTTVGGDSANSRNLISANNGAGILITGSAATGNTLKDNLIGTDTSGLTPLTGQTSGVDIIDTLVTVNGVIEAAEGITVAAAGTLGGSGVVNGPVTVNGSLTPGNSPGVLATGDLVLNGSFDVEVDGDGGAGVINGHDQVDVTGSVTLGGTLNVDTTDLTAVELSPGAEFVIINNDGMDIATGNFSNFTSGSAVIINAAGSGLNLVLTYTGGDGNDVALQAFRPETEVEIVGGNLVVTDSNGGDTNDSLTFTADGTNLTITDNNGNGIDLIGSLNAGTGDGSSTVVIPLSSFSGGTLDINSLAGDDSITFGALTLLSGQSLDFDGGTGLDTATVTGSIGSFASNVVISVSNGVTLAGASAEISTFGGDLTINADSDANGMGTFAIDDAAGSINTSTEGPSGNISITAADVELVGTIFAPDGDVLLEASNAGASIDLGTTGGSGQFVLTGAELDQVNTLGQLTVGNAATGNIVINGTVAPANANNLNLIAGGTVNDGGGSITTTNLTINAASGIGTTGAVITTVSNFEADGGSGGIDVSNSGNLVIGGLTETLAGLTTDANINIASSGDIFIGENIIKATGGDTSLTLQAGNDIKTNGANITSASSRLNVTLNSDRDESGFGGIFLNGGTVIDSNGGNITLGGGADPTTTPARGTLGSDAEGVALRDAQLNSGAGNISILGTGMAGSGSEATSGVQVFAPSIIQTTTGNITLIGTGGTGTSAAEGVFIDGLVTTDSGSVIVDGVGGTGSRPEGVRFSVNGRLVTTGNAPISITGVGNGSSEGIVTTSANNVIGGPSASGDITLKSDTIDLAGGAVQSSGNLTIAPATPSTSVGIGNGIGTLSLTTAELSRLANGFASIHIGDEATGVIEVQAVTFVDPVTIEGDEIHVEGQITGADNASITLFEFFDGGPGIPGPATTYLNAPIVTNGNSVTIDDRLLVGTNASIDTTNGGASPDANVTFTQPVDSQFMTSNSLSIDAGIVGQVTFQNEVGSDTPLLNLDVVGTTVFDGGNLTIDGELNFEGDFVIGEGIVNLTTLNASDVYFGGTIDSHTELTKRLTINTSNEGVTRFEGTVGTMNGVRSLQTNADGRTEIAADIFTSGGDIDFGDAVLIDNDVRIEADLGLLTFESTIDGSVNGLFNLTIAAIGEAEIVINGAIGSDALGADSSDAGLGSLIVENQTRFNGGSIQSVGDLTFAEQLTIGTNTTLTSTGTGNVTFSGNVDTAAGSPFNLSIDTGLGNYFQDNSSSLLNTSGGDLTIAASDVTLEGTINTGSGRVTFEQTQPSGEIVLGSQPGTLSLSDVEIDQITTSAGIAIGNTGTGDIKILEDISPAGTNSLFLTTGGRILSDNPGAVLDVANLSLSAEQGIGLNGPVNLAVNNALAMESQFGTIDIFSGQDITVGTVDGLAGATALGNITLNATGGVTLSSGVTATGNGSIEINAARQITVNGGASVSSTSGAIALDANSSGLATGNFSGVFVADSATVSSTTGDITVTGHGGDAASNGNHGVQLAGTAAITSQGGNITLTGQAGGAGATNFHEGVIVGGNVTTTGSGNITVNGTGGSTGTVNIGVDLISGTISTVNGTVVLNGVSGAGSSSDAIRLANFGGGGSVIETTGSGMIVLVADASAGSGVGLNAFGAGSAIGGALTTADIFITTDTISLAVPVQSTGDLFIEPLSSNTSIGLGGGAGTLNIDDAEFATFDNFRQVNIGLFEASNLIQIDELDLSDKSFDLFTTGGRTEFMGTLTLRDDGRLVMVVADQLADLHAGASDVIIGGSNGSIAFDLAAGVDPLSIDGNFDFEAARFAAQTLTGSLAFSVNSSSTVDIVDEVAGLNTSFGGDILLETQDLTISAPVQTTGAGAVSIDASDVIVLDDTIISDSGDVTLQSQTGIAGTSNSSIQTAAGAVTLESDADNLGSDGTVNFAGTIIHGTGGTTIVVTANSTIGGVISGAAGLTKNGNGSLTLSGSNLFDGETTIAEGVIAATNTAALGTTLGGTTVADGAALLIDGVSIADNVTISGVGVNVSGINAALAGAGTASLTGDLTLADDAQINAAFRGGSTIFTIAGAITEIGGPRSLTLQSSVGGGETIVLSNPLNNWTGDTNVVNNTLVLGADEVIPSDGNVNVSSTIDLNGHVESIGGLNGTGTVTNQGITAATVTVGSNNASGNFAGSIVDGIGSSNLTKVGMGLQTLSGLNSATGVLAVNGGMLAIDGTWGGTATVAAGATFGGTGSVDGSVTTDGTIAPGNSPGILSTGDVTFAAGSAFTVEIEGTIPGSGIGGHDQLNVNGSVTIGNLVTLTAILGPGFEPFDGDEFVIINNDGMDAVVGTFAGFEEGSTFDVNGQTLSITYVGGDGNDVVLLGQGTASTLITLDPSNNLLITDVNGGDSNDTLTIVSDVSNSQFIITDPGRSLTTNVAGAVRVDSRTVTVPFASVAGTNVNFNLLDGDDSLTIDLSLGNFGKSINVFGGNELEVGDALLIQGGATFETVSFANFGPGQGTVTITDNQSINYFDVEPVRSTIDADNIALTNQSAFGEFSITDSGTAGETSVTPPIGDGVTFRNPNAVLALLGNGMTDDIVNVNGFGSGFGAVIGIDGMGGNDAVNWNTTEVVTAVDIDSATISINSGVISTLGDQLLGGNILLPTDAVLSGANIELNGSVNDATLPGGATLTVNSTGSATVNALLGSSGGLGLVTVNATEGSVAFNGLINDLGNGGLNVSSSDTITFNGLFNASGAAGISAVAARSVTLNPGTNFSLNDGDVNLQANQQPTPTTGPFTGITLDGASITTSNGNVTLAGRGGDVFLGNIGVAVQNGSTVTSLGSGSVNVIGAGGPSDFDGTGVVITGPGSTVSANTGVIVISGIGGTTGEQNQGIRITDGAQVQSIGTGPTAAPINIVGTSGEGSNNNDGVQIDGLTTRVSTIDGDIIITGTAGPLAGENSHGVKIATGATVESTGALSFAGDINIQGTATSGLANDGVNITGGSLVQSTDGSISINGVGTAGSGLSNNGVEISGNSTVAASVGGSVNITGVAAGTSANEGIRIDGANVGSPTGFGPINLHGNTVFVAGTVTNIGTGSITINGDDGVTLANPFTTIQSGSGPLTIDGDFDSNNAGSVTVTDPSVQINSDAGGIFISGVNAQLQGAVQSVGGGVTLAAPVSLQGDLTISGTSATFENSVTGNSRNLTTSGATTFRGNGTALNSLNVNGDLITDPVTLTIATPLVIQTGFNAQLQGTVNAQIVGQAGSSITATGNLILGDNSAAGFATAGDLFVNGFNVTLRDSDAVQLGSLTLLDDTGVLSAVNGVQLSMGDVLSGSGRIIGPLSAQAGSDVDLSLSTGILRTDSVTFAADSSFQVELSDTLPGNGHDQLSVTGTVNLGGTTLGATLTQPASMGDEFVIVNNDGTDAIVGTFAGLPEGAFVDLNIGSRELITGTQRFVISYARGTGNDVTLRPAAAISGRVFNDVNYDGVDNELMNGVGNATVRLIAQNGTTVVRTTTSSTDGSYSFTGLIPGAYFVEFVAPTGFHFTFRDVGGNDTIDSDANRFTGRTTLLTASTSGQLINDVDAGIKASEISINNVQKSEGLFGQQTAYTFTVSLSGIARQVTTVNFATANGTATVANNDYTAKSGTVTFAVGQQTRTVTVLVTGDNAIEGDENFFVNLSNAVNASIVTPQGIGTILNDDTVVPNIAITDVSRNEGNAPESTEFEFTVSLNFASTETITVDFATVDGAATVAGSDYLASSGTITFLPGETEATFAITVNGDDDIEDSEDFSVRLTNVTGNAAITDDTGVATIVNDDFAERQLSITDVTVEEGGVGARTNLLFKVRLSAVALVETKVDFSLEDDDALAGFDFESVSGTLTFLPDDFEKTIVVTALGDFDVENDEQFFVNLSNAIGASISDSQGIGTILNDDQPLQDISIADVSVAEGSSGSTTRVQVTVSLSGPSATPVSVDFSTADGTAIAGQDYTLRTGTVTFAPGEINRTIGLDVLGDATVESNERFFINLFNPVNGTIVDNQSTFTIRNDDAVIPNVTVSDVTIAEGALGERTRVDFSVQLSGPTTQPVSVNFNTMDGTARLSEGDYEAQQGTLTFTPGDTQRIVTVIFNGDFDVEGDEFLFLNLSNPVGANILDGQGRALVINDDAAIPNISISNTQVIEGSTGERTPAIFEITLSGPTTQDVTFDFATGFASAISTTDVSAAAATAAAVGATSSTVADFEAASGTVVIPAGETSAFVSVVVLGDADVEADEFFFLNLSNATGGVLIDDQGEASILNDDLDVQALSVSDVTKLEGLAGVRTSYRFTVSLTGPSSAPVTVDFATADGSATAASGDYDSTVGSLIFAPGETSKEVIVTVNGDIANEANEQFFLNLSNVIGATVEDGQGLGVITNDDSPVPSLTIDDVSKTEGDAGARNQFNFVLRLSNAAEGPVTVQATTVAGTATSGVDFEATTTTVTFAAGETIATVTVPVLGDFTDEASETFFVNLSGISGATLDDDQGRGTIRNDDSPIPNINVNNAFVEEGIAGQRPQIAFIVSLSGPSSVPVEVDFSTMGATATSGIDFEALSGTLRFEPGEETKAVRVTILGDLDVEADEMLFLNLDNPVNGILDDDQAIGTINNDDAVPTLAIGDVSKVEGSSGQRTQFIFDVVLTGFSSNPVTVDFASADGTATFAGLDYTTVNGSLSFLPGETLKQIVVNVSGDSAIETDEFFFINLSNAVGAEVIANQGTGTIRNDDAAVPLLRIDDFSADEGISGARTQFNFNVTLSAASNQTLTVDYSTAAGTATSGVDFVALDETLTFLPGETTQTITVSVLGDTAFESLETFFVNLSNPQGLEIADDQAIGRIVNDDSPTPLLSVSNAQTEEGISGERPSVTFNLTLSSPPTELITVDYATGDGTASSTDLDYLSTNGTITFLPGQQTASVTITVLGDSNVETNETFFLNLGNLTGNAVFQNDQGTGLILNDDVLRPGITISDAVQEEGVSSQRTRFTFDVSLSTPATTATGPIEVRYQTANGSAIGAAAGVVDAAGNPIVNPNADYESRTGILTFQPGEQTKQIVVIVLGDSRIEADETFFVNLTSSSTNAEIVDDQALATVFNDDFPLPGVSISNATVVEGTAGQRTIVDVELALSAPSATSIFVDFQTANGTATIAGQDYQAANGAVEFMPTEIVKTVRLIVLGDNVEEAAETFFLNLTGVSPNAQIVDDQASITIQNDDLMQVTPDISISDVQLKEGNDRALPEFQFVVTLSAVATTNVTVDYSTAQGTANTSDFIAKSGTLTFQPGETSKTVDIEVRGDEIVETDETFFVNLNNAVGGVITDAQGRGTITNDDVAMLPGIRIDDVAFEEGSTDEITEFTFTVALTGVFDQAVEVSYFTSQFSASSNVDDRDFFRISNLADPDSISKLTFEPGETTQTITVQVIGDDEVEADETFFVNLFAAVNGIIEDDQGEGFIINDDQSLPQVEISDAIALEGDSGTTTFTFTVTLDRGADTTATVDFNTANGTTGTSAGADVRAASGTVTFAPGEVVKTIEIEVVGDLIDEVDEQFFVNLTNANGLLIADDQGRGVILDDDDPQAILAVTDAVNLTDEFGQEGNTGNVTYEFTIQLVGKPTGPVTVQVATQDGTAIAGQDYNALSKQLTFNPGESTKKVQVTVSSDRTVETDEEFFLNLSNAVGATIFDDQGIATIINDDAVVTRDEGLELAEDVSNQVEAALADPTMDGTVPGNGIKVIKGTNSGGRSDITDLLVQIGLDVIRRLGLTDAIVAVFDPVNFIVTTPEGRANGFTESSGVVGQSTNSFYSGDGAVELLVIPNASAGIYNLELAGVNNGQFRAAVSRVDASGQIGTETFEGTLAGELELALDFTRAFPNDPARNAKAEQAFLALFQEFGGDSDAIDLALAAFTHSPRSDADEQQISNQNDAAAQLQAAAAAIAAQAKLLATALQNALPDWVNSGLAGAFTPSDLTARGFETNSESSTAMRDFFWESVGRGVLGLPGGVDDVMDLLDPLIPETEKTETAADEVDDNDKENDGTPAENEEGSQRKRAEKPETDDERRQAFLRQRDEDEVALYVPAAAFAGPDWLTKAEAAAEKSRASQTGRSAEESKSDQQNSTGLADQNAKTDEAADTQQESNGNDEGN